MADNVAGNLKTNIPQPADPQRVVRVYHSESNPQGSQFARGQGICIGTGPWAGWVWKKTTSTTSWNDWVVDIQPTAGSNSGGSSAPIGGGGLNPQ